MSRTDRWKLSPIIILLFSALLLFSNLNLSQSQAAEPSQPNTTAEQMMAGLSDEQVRQLLIDELKKDAQVEELSSQQMKGPAFFFARLLDRLSNVHDDNKDEVKALFASFPAMGPDLYKVFIKL